MPTYLDNSGSLVSRDVPDVTGIDVADTASNVPVDVEIDDDTAACLALYVKAGEVKREAIGDYEHYRATLHAALGGDVDRPRSARGIHKGTVVVELRIGSRSTCDLDALREDWPDAYAACVRSTPVRRLVVVRR